MKTEIYSYVYSNFSIDATEAEGLGKYVNDSTQSNSNAKMKLIMVNGEPTLCLFACIEGIKVGTELRWKC